MFLFEVRYCIFLFWENTTTKIIIIFICTFTHNLHSQNIQSYTHSAHHNHKQLPIKNTRTLAYTLMSSSSSSDPCPAPTSVCPPVYISRSQSLSSRDASLLLKAMSLSTKLKEEKKGLRNMKTNKKLHNLSLFCFQH